MHYRFHVNVLGSPFACTWEDAAAALELLPRMIFEPDGSWILSGGAGNQRWQVDGHLFDFDSRLHRVELRGSCPQKQWDQLLACFGGPQTQWKFELVQEGVQLDDPDFRLHAAEN